jgi:S1-C subfamily serine protease
MDATDEGGTEDVNSGSGTYDPWSQREPTAPTPPAPGGPASPTPPWGTPPSGADPTGQWPVGWAQPAHQWAPPRPPQRRSALLPVLLALAALLFLGAGLAIGYGVWTGTRPTANLVPRTIQPPVANPEPNAGSGGVSDAGAVAAKVDPGLVDVNTTLSYQQVEGAGTGIVLTSNGEVLTNNHVIEGATNISVRDIGNGQTYSATVVGYDVTRDLAILQLKGASGLKTASLGNSAKVTPGTPVVAVGNAQGAGGTPSYATGSVTALNQTITASDELTGSRQLTGLIESNVVIQQGDSGGPVVTKDGKVVAMDTAAASFGFGFGGQAAGGSPSYSIPIDLAVKVAGEIESGQASSTVHIGPTAFLGVQVEAAGGNGLGILGGGLGQQQPTTGVEVAGVVNGEPAGEAGITVGDVITKVGGTTVDSPNALTKALGGYHPGGKVQIDWVDPSGQSHSATVQLASGPPQ